VEEVKIRNMIHVRVHVMGCWEGGHMTNFLKWSKVTFVALHCSFQDQFELCSKVLLLWRYEVKDFQKHHIFFCFFLHFSQWKQHQITWFHHIWKAKGRGYNFRAVSKNHPTTQIALMIQRGHGWWWELMGWWDRITLHCWVSQCESSYEGKRRVGRRH